MQVSTVLEIKNLTAEGYYSITGSRGLQLRVTKYGKEFYFRYSWKGKRQLFKIGTSDSVSLSDARKKAIELSELVRKGTNPKEQKTAGKEECTVEVKRKTFKECALDWVKERATNNFWKNNVKGEANTLSRLSNRKILGTFCSLFGTGVLLHLQKFSLTLELFYDGQSHFVSEKIARIRLIFLELLGS